MSGRVVTGYNLIKSESDLTEQCVKCSSLFTYLTDLTFFVTLVVNNACMCVWGGGGGGGGMSLTTSAA